MNKPGLLFMALRPTNQLVKYSLLFRTLVCSALYVAYLGVNTVSSSGTLGGINWWCHRVQKGRKKTKCKRTSGTTERAQQKRRLGPGVHKSRPPGRSGYYILRGGAHIIESFVWNFLRVTHLVSKILTWITDFWKNCGPLLQTSVIQQKTNYIPASPYRTVTQTMFQLKCNTIYWIVYPWMYKFSKNLTATSKF